MQHDFQPAHNVTRAVIYARVSSKAQTKRGDGLNSQATRCRQYADYKGYDVVQVFTDDVTGQTADRIGLQSMLKFLRSDRKTPHVVIIDDLSRFARRVPVHFELREAIAKAGGILESPSVELRTDADGELHEYILASVAQHQSRKNAEQTLNRMKARCFNGYWVFSAPIGFKFQKTNGHGKLLVRDEPLASIVQEALEGYAAGRFGSQAEVKRFFENQPDFPKDLPDGKIRNQRVNNILTRVTYAGYMDVPKWDIPLRKAQHTGLISLQTHQKIQDRIKGKVKMPSKPNLNADFPLRGFVLCADCDSPLTACWSTSSTGKKHPYYLCHTRSCASHRKSIPRDRMESEFKELLTELEPSQTLFALTKAMFKSAWGVRAVQASTRKSAMKDEAIKVQKQIDQLVDRVMDSSSATVITAYEKRITLLEREKMILTEKAKNSVLSKRPFDEMFELAMNFLSSPCKLWASDRLEDKRTVLKLAFLERLPYDRKHGFRTPQPTVPFRFLGNNNMKCKLVHPARFERATSAFGGHP